QWSTFHPVRTGGTPLSICASDEPSYGLVSTWPRQPKRITNDHHPDQILRTPGNNEPGIFQGSGTLRAKSPRPLPESCRTVVAVTRGSLSAPTGSETRWTRGINTIGGIRK